ncbi:hypothetical protein [Metallosphaera javensis (ex Sakai et al. 2022)]
MNLLILLEVEETEVRNAAISPVKELPPIPGPQEFSRTHPRSEYFHP